MGCTPIPLIPPPPHQQENAVYRERGADPVIEIYGLTLVACLAVIVLTSAGHLAGVF